MPDQVRKVRRGAVVGQPMGFLLLSQRCPSGALHIVVFMTHALQNISAITVTAVATVTKFSLAMMLNIFFIVLLLLDGSCFPYCSLAATSFVPPHPFAARKLLGSSCRSLRSRKRFSASRLISSLLPILVVCMKLSSSLLSK